MLKAIKYIVLSMSVATLTSIGADAKSVPGIPPVYSSQGTANQDAVWVDSRQGPALLELQRRSPGRLLNSLVQEDGIINVSPHLLTGLNATARPSEVISRLPKQKIPGGSNLCGFIAYNEASLDYGIYRLPILASQSPTLLRGTQGLLSSFRGGAASDRFYVMSYFGTTIQNGQDQCLTAIFDKNDWTMLAEKGDYGQYERVCSDMTYDPITNRFYGCFLNRKQSQWLLGYMQLDESSPVSTISSIHEICPLSVSLNGLAADANGVLWGIRNDNGDLVKINKKTGEMTRVASTYFVPGYNGSLTWDDTNNLLYWAVTYDDPESASGIASALLTVDSTSGELKHVYDYSAPTQTCGLYAEFTAPAATPGLFTALKADFDKESLSGKVIFDAPSTTTDGKAASGNLEYTLSIVKDNGYVAYRKDMTSSYGAKNVTVPVEIKSPGNYTFTVQGHNNAGNGYPTSVSAYVGSDLPMDARNINVQYADGMLNVTWNPVTETIHGGYFDPDDVKYVVTATQSDSDGNLTELETLTVTDTKAQWSVGNSDALRGYQVSVTPVFGANYGEATIVPYTWFGYLTAPFGQSMKAKVDGWTTVNEGNGSPWQKEYNSNGSGWAIAYNWGTSNYAWLFSPKIKLEKGRYYTMSFISWSPIVANTMEVWIGNANTSAGMQTKLTEFAVPGYTKESKPVLTTFGFACDETGYYYLGLLNNTRSDTYTNVPYMWVNNLTCTEAPDNAPSAPEMTVDYDKTGQVSAAVTIVAPTKTYNGNAITKLDAVTLSVNGTAVQEWTDVQPGSTLTYDYTGTKAGTHSFIAEAVYGRTHGVPAITNLHLGMSVPVDPEWVEAVEMADTPGTLEVSWAPVAVGTNGQEIAAEAMSYNVMNILSNSYVQRGVKEQPFKWEACGTEDQTAVLMAVNAETTAGTSSTYGTYAKQSIMHVGKPYDLPVRDTFAGGRVLHSWSVVNMHSSYDHCSVVNTKSEFGDKDANGDGYCLLAFVPYENSQASLYSGKIVVPADANNPVFGFAVYRRNYDGVSDNNNTVVVSVLGDKTQGNLRPVRAGDQAYGWQYYYYDMSIFKGQTVNILFTFQTRSYTSHYIDDIHFFDAQKKDLAVTGVTSPDKVAPDSRARFSVSVTNLGTSPLEKGNAYVELRRINDDEVVATREVPALSPFQSVNVNLTDNTLNNSFDSEVNYKATVVYDGDANSDNNSGEASVLLVLPTLPAPQSLTGDRNDEGFASLAWEAPDLSPAYESYEIGFETSVEPSMTALEGFRSLDVDGNNVDTELGISGPQGFTSFYHPTLSHSGSWMIVSPCNAGGKEKEDWLISPKLSGDAQTISFYARTNWNAYETYSVKISTTGDEPADFTTTVMETTTDSNDWKRVDIEVPAGTLYFAIVSKAEDTSDLIYLMLDDFTFEGADANEGLVVEGYYAYRDNSMIESIEPRQQWEDVTGNPGPHFYRVTANYGDRGESPSSNELFLFTRGTGVEGINAATGKVFSRPGQIIVEGADGAEVAVSDINGIVIFRTASAAASEIIEAVAGLYVVTIDGASVKLQVP